ncbi:MAG: C-terminal binding protein [Lentisphaerae bacterium]|nr:C-terminal binding protein [Lentisphaerota bacterium]
MLEIAMVSAGEERFPASCISRIREVAIINCRRCNTPDELVEFAGNADIIWMFGANVAVKPEALAKLPECRAVLRSGSGLDALPLEFCKANNIQVFNTPESISESVAEHAVSMLFALARNLVQFDRQVRQGQWDSSGNQTKWHLSGRTLGVVGYGRIARTVEKLVSGFNMRVLHFDPWSENSTPLDILLKESDFVSLHCPLTDDTRNLMDDDKFSIMKKDALLVNTSRGEVIDEAALYRALTTGHLGGAALDVLCDEPPLPDNPLLNCEKVIFSPHAAAFSADFEKNFWYYSAEKLVEICGRLEG